MNKKAIGIGAIVVVVILAAGYFYQTMPTETYTVSFINNNGDEIGTAAMKETRSGVLIQLNVSGLTPNGEHAIHVHETGDCTPVETFANAGAHFNPEDKAHGLQHPQGHHAGDMLNLKPDEAGVLKDVNIMNRSITLQSRQTSRDGRYSILDINGAALVIHADPDDHVSQPSGEAGGRIACGVITQ